MREYKRLYWSSAITAIQKTPSLVKGAVTMQDIVIVLNDVANRAVGSAGHDGPDHATIEDLTADEFEHLCRIAYSDLLSRKASAKTRLNAACRELSKLKKWDSITVAKALAKHSCALVLTHGEELQEDIREKAATFA